MNVMRADRKIGLLHMADTWLPKTQGRQSREAPSEGR